MSSDKKTSRVSAFFSGLKTEYNKIIFPTRQQVMKETGATIAVSFLIGVLIALIDVIMKSGLGLIIK